LAISGEMSFRQKAQKKPEDWAHVGRWMFHVGDHLEDALARANGTLRFVSN